MPLVEIGRQRLACSSPNAAIENNRWTDFLDWQAFRAAAGPKEWDAPNPAFPICRCSKRHRHQEFLAFLRLIDRETPPGLDLHLVLDNYATHNHPKIRAWLAKRSRFHLHFTPTSAFWLNQMERWFALISQRAIKHGSFDSVTHLVRTIKRFIDDYTETAAPFVWVATADSILQKIERLSVCIWGTQH